MLVKQLAAVLKNRRKSLRLTQLTLADLAGVSAATLYNLERGEGNPCLDVLNKLTDVLGLEIKIQLKTSAAE